MARKKARPYGSGAVVLLKSSMAIRWYETVPTEDGPRRVMRYQNLGAVTKKEAEAKLQERLVESREPRQETAPTKEIPTFTQVAEGYERDVLATLKFSTRTNRTVVLNHRLKPIFGMKKISDIGRKEVQQFMTSLRETGFEVKQTGAREAYSAHSLHSTLSVLRGVLSYSNDLHGQPVDDVTGRPFNPAIGIKGLPKLKPKRKKWALSADQAGALIGGMKKGKARVMVALAITCGLRRGELLALRLGDISARQETEGGPRFGLITVSRASYQGHVDTPKTEAGVRSVDVHPWVLGLIEEWARTTGKKEPEDLLFGTRKNQLENSNNILRRSVYPACKKIGVPYATWLTFRRTFQTLAHHVGIPARTIADMVGHQDVGTQFIYVQPVDNMKRVAAEKVGEKLCEIVRNLDERTVSVH
jgi:integrase